MADTPPRRVGEYPTIERTSRRYPTIERTPCSNENIYTEEPNCLPKAPSKPDRFSIYDDDNANIHYLVLPTGKLEIKKCSSRTPRKHPKGQGLRINIENHPCTLGENTDSPKRTSCFLCTKNHAIVERRKRSEDRLRYRHTFDFNTARITQQNDYVINDDYCHLKPGAVSPECPRSAPPILEEKENETPMLSISFQQSCDTLLPKIRFNKDAEPASEDSICRTYQCDTQNPLPARGGSVLDTLVEERTCRRRKDTNDAGCLCVRGRKFIIARWLCMVVFLPCLFCYLGIKLYRTCRVSKQSNEEESASLNKTELIIKETKKETETNRGSKEVT